LAFTETCRNLVEFKGYPRWVTGLRYDNSKISRGIAADVSLGTLLKLDYRDRVRRAWRGSRRLSDGEIADLYGGKSLTFDDGIYTEIHSPFDLPAGRLFALLQDPSRRTDAWAPDFRSLLDDIREMLDRSHTIGDLKRQIGRDPARFVERRPGVAKLLAGLRSAGKQTFLLTNSGLDYTIRLLDYLFGAATDGGWRGIFDVLAVDADKPRFFTADAARPRSENERHESSRFDPVTVRHGGDVVGLEQCLGLGGGDVLFVGDNPAADSVAAHSHGWRTAMVVPELENEPSPPGFAPPAPDLNRKIEPDSIFWEGGTPTRFSRVIRESADVFSARVETILSAGPDGLFSTD
jgi:HAD superfamily 5'-nucleotidase-like hydrolase